MAEQRLCSMERFRKNGWKISDGRWPEPPFLAVHEDFDASYEGAEGGWVGNGLAAHSNTLSGLLEDLDAIQDEHPHFTEKFSA